MQDVRRLIHALRPPVLDDMGLVPALRSLPVSLGHAVTCTTFVIDAPDTLPPLPAAVEVAAYRIVQEALTNVVKHAQAHNCLVTLSYDDVLHVSIRDDGCGIAEGRVSGVGLASMRERAEELGGTCQVDAGDGEGTNVLARLPLRISDLD
jgi:signal transduction histidine kinase